MDELMMKQIREAVASIFSEQEEASKIDKTEKALKESAEKITELINHIDEKAAIIVGNTEEIAKQQETIKVLTTELEAAKVDMASTKAELEKASNELADIKKMEIAKARMVELEEAKVADSNKQAQLDKIMNFSNEEFSSYKDERISLRTLIMAELEASKAALEQQKPADPAVASKDEVVPAPKISTGHAIAAALNLEVHPSKDTKSKYDELGKAMAEAFKTSK